MDNKLDYFVGSVLKLEQSRRHLHSLVLAVGEFAAQHPPYLDQKMGPDGVPSLSIVTPDVPIPHEISLLAGDTIHNMRSALDLMMCEIAQHRGKSQDGVKFPFAADKVTLDRIIKKEILRLGKDVADLVGSLRPYKGGNGPLRALHDLDVLDKHKLLVPISRQSFYLKCSLDLFYVDYMGQQQQKTVKISEGIHNIGINGMPGTAMTYHINFPLDYDYISVTFGQSAPFASQPVLGTLGLLIDMVSEIIDKFKYHCSN